MASMLSRGTGGTDIPVDGRAVVRLLDAIDRARLTPMDVLLLVHVAEGVATVATLAERVGRRRADVRRATGRLVARGLMRRRAGKGEGGLTFTATASGREILDGLEAPSSLRATDRSGAPAPRRPRSASRAGREVHPAPGRR